MCVNMCVLVLRGQGVKGVVVMATPLRLPSQFYLSMQHSPLCLSFFLPVCVSVCVSSC